MIDWVRDIQCKLNPRTNSIPMEKDEKEMLKATTDSFFNRLTQRRDLLTSRTETATTTATTTTTAANSLPEPPDNIALHDDVIGKKHLILKVIGIDPQTKGAT